jgi:hypothetical protein
MVGISSEHVAAYYPACSISDRRKLGGPRLGAASLQPIFLSRFLNVAIKVSRKVS